MSKLLKSNISIFIYALLGTLFFSFNVTKETFSMVSSSGSALIWTAIPILLFIVYKKIITKCERPGILFIIFAGVISIVFSAASVMGAFYSVNADFAVIFANGRHIRSKMLVVFFGGCIFFYLMVKAVASFTKLVNLNIPAKFQKVLSFLFEKHCFLKSFLIMGFCWVPHIIIHYPVSIPFDGIISIMQYYGYRPYTTQHPIIHMQLLGHFSDLGVRLGSVTYGLVIMGVLQAFLLLLTLAYTISTMEKLKVCRYFQLAALIVFSVVPIFPGYATTLLGDIPYCMALLLLMNEFAWYLFKTDSYMKNWKHPVLTVIAVLGAFFRQNGIYVIAVILLFVAIREIWLLRHHKQTVRGAILILAVLFIPLCAGKANNTWLTNKYECTNISKRAIFAIPMQQIARYMVYHSEDMTADELAEIQKVMKYEPEEYQKLYRPTNYDGVKNGFNQNATKEELKGFLKTWFKLFFRHPSTYVNATLSQTYSLFSPLADNQRYYFGTSPCIRKIKDPDYVSFYYQTKRLEEKKQAMSEEYYDKFCDFPILGFYVNQGIMDFLLLAACLWALCRGNGKLLLLGLPLLLTLAVTFVGPAVIGHTRYTFPIFYGMPLFFGIYVSQNQNFHKKK